MSTIYKTEAGGNEIQRRYAEILNGWPVPAEHLHLSTREGETFVVVSGPPGAPPLLLLHGSGTNAAIWMSDVPAWAEHFRVYAVDLIGEPGLSAPARPPLNSEAYALWLDDVLGALGITRTAVVGASLGGWLALDYATRRPDRVDHLVVLCPGGLGKQKMGWLPKAILLRPFGKWGRRKTLKTVAGIDFSTIQTAAGLDTSRTQEFIDYVMLTAAHFKPRIERLPLFSDDALHRLTMPMLVIVGERDAMLDSHETAQRVAHTVPHATVTILPGVAHSITGQTQPILEFLLG
ncbi:Alpha/beta hydrolase [Frankia sp. Hr75.2]|nr:Alpha/beta hydrolase [Frankia sp. Hr75.2]